MNFIKNLFGKKNLSRTISFLLVIVAFVIIESLISGGSLKSLYKNLLIPVSSYIIVALALNLVVGVSGELSLGHAGFMSVGAFTGVIVSGYLADSISSPVTRLIIAMICGAIAAGFVGFIISIPVLKLQGDYLAIVTLAFGQIIKSLINNIYLGFDNAGWHFSFIKQKFELATGGKMLLKGPMGATSIQKVPVEKLFVVCFIVILLTLIIIYNFMNSKHGRAVAATRDNRIAAQSVGVNVVRTKTLAFVISAAIAGVAGVLYALYYSTLLPAKFDFNQSILILVYVVLGGLGNMTGTIISTTLLVVLPELLRSLQTYRMLIYAIVLILIMIVTNNPVIRDLIDRIKNKKKEGEESNG